MRRGVLCQKAVFSYVNWERNTIEGSLEAKRYKMWESVVDLVNECEMSLFIWIIWGWSGRSWFGLVESVIGDWDFFRKWELEMVEEGSLVNMWFGIIFNFPNERILKIDSHVF